ncbi:glutamate-cysteine ligase family protein [Roseivirga sp. UBA1976]|mgnify:CR=1 FL=1|uniref:carboxylate-amine ligase n=1 Tax=Roseivirga sp. UBA1976 TaxID=1947386 RepID=UPI00257B6968|nr:glutamate-cysteine ligase family protein [Roseivirga sp. UBA1976]MEC7755132.1 glutamate-cysteine ligase family protein [Bacteroidota bacterium]|tara:strand:+ start:4105 stop:5367 length:1263 start_codon:yes stop_codon:yes gene_type:complete
MEDNRLHLFQAFGIELEYMIVDIETLDVKPIADEVLKSLAGEITNEITFGSVTWSNELALHVIELKCSAPTGNLQQLAVDFEEAVQQMNSALAQFNAQLMPSAAHPWMNPETETVRWPHDNAEIYATYDRIFNCKGHGWSNLQSMHINLPFANDEEFGRLHAAIRTLLPIMPALSASSPILDGKDTGFWDKRLDYYRKNQKAVPVLTGQVIPEPVFTQNEYQAQIFDRIARDIKMHDQEGILEPIWLNSRGAIARFDRGAIEIRILDVQECPKADLAIASLIIHALKLLTEEHLMSLEQQQKFKTEALATLFNQVIKHGEHSLIQDAAYLKVFGLNAVTEMTATELWQYIKRKVDRRYPEALSYWQSEIELLFDEGTLSTRVLNALEANLEHDNLKMVYSELCDCLESNQMLRECLEEAF